MKRSTRREIARDTLNILETGYYFNANEDIVNIAAQQKKAVENTLLYTPSELLDLLENQTFQEKEWNTEFEVNGLTTLDSTRKEFETNQKVICLNFASARNPGGGFLNGSQAQEESIARATGLYPCQLKAENYYKSNRAITTCLYTDHIIYSPGVPILKDEEGKLLDDFSFASIITAPAVNTGVVLRNEPQNIDKIETMMSRRIDMVLAICKKHNYETLILGAWGCGVFRNDPEVIAEMFKLHLGGKYKNQFRRVVFSIYARNERFIQPFIEKFS